MLTLSGGGGPPPWTIVAAARPARAPEISMTVAQLRSTLIPALRAARGLAPTVRNWKPIVLRDSSQATTATAASASRKPTLACGGGPPTCGKIALELMGGAIELDWPGCCSRCGDESR